MIRRLEEQLMPLARIAGLLITVLAAGCATMDRAPADDPTKPGVSQESVPVAEKPPVPAVRSEPVPAKPAQPAPRPSAPVTAEPVAPPAAPATSPNVAKPEAPAAKPEAPAAKPVAKAPAPAEPAPKKEAAAVPAPKPAAAPLDLALLEKKLKETNAIGVFTKLTLKNQVDALLEQFRAYYQGRIKTTLAQLRQPYEQLLLKVLSLLQDSDPPLAQEITQSREAIWGILSDPVKFNNL
jgi:cytoskeletal protein RodZ